VESGFCLGLQNLAATVEPGRADVVAQVGFASGGLDGDAWNRKGIVRTVHAAFRRGFFVLLYSHDSLLKKAVIGDRF
jgi:hypothetical protein